MSALAKLVLEFDRNYPGDPSDPMELPATEWARLVAQARAESGISDDSEAAFLESAAKGCHSCSCCQQVPCDACQAGGVCDALPCRNDERDSEDDGDDDDEAAE